MKERREGVQEGRHYGIDREREREREVALYMLHVARCRDGLQALGKGKWRYRLSAEQIRAAEQGSHCHCHSLLTQFRLRVVGRLHAMQWAQAGRQAGRAWKLKVDRSRGTWRQTAAAIYPFQSLAAYEILS